MLFYETLPCSVLCCFSGEIGKGEQMDFKICHCAQVTSASTNAHHKNP